MVIEIRPIKPEEQDEFRRVASTALVMNATFEGLLPEWTICAFEDGKLATTMGAWPLTMNMNGIDAKVSGVTAVGTLPAYRRRGYLRNIMSRHFQNLYENGAYSMAALYASRAAIYQRFGYGVVATYQSYTVEPRYIQFTLPHAVTGKLREAGDKDFEALESIYSKFREPRTGYLHRNKAMWDHGIFSGMPQNGSLNKVIYEENGIPLGYVIYSMFQPQGGGPPSGARMWIRDLAWLNFSAYRAIWEHFINMDLIQEFYWRAPAGDPLPHLILEPRRLSATAGDGLMARLIDVRKAMTQRGYQSDASLTFEISDDICPWNTGKWKLETSAKSSRVTKTRLPAQLKLPASTLAMLLFNQITATEAMRMHRLDTSNTDALKKWDGVMQTQYKPGCADNF